MHIDVGNPHLLMYPQKDIGYGERQTEYCVLHASALNVFGVNNQYYFRYGKDGGHRMTKMFIVVLFVHFSLLNLS